jgi:hypothetical protein
LSVELAGDALYDAVECLPGAAPDGRDDGCLPSVVPADADGTACQNMPGGLGIASLDALGGLDVVPADTLGGLDAAPALNGDAGGAGSASAAQASRSVALESASDS